MTKKLIELQELDDVLDNINKDSKVEYDEVEMLAFAMR